MQTTNRLHTKTPIFALTVILFFEAHVVFQLNAADGVGDHKISGRGTEVLFEGPVNGGAHVRFDLLPANYPLPSGKDPAYQYILNSPVTTNKVRFVSNDATADITEIRLFEPGMPTYPDVMREDEEGLGLVNYALNAPVTASSRWGDRYERFAVDGSLSFESRWYSGRAASPPNWLVIDLQQERSIGCIQMVSGYLSGDERLRVAQDFRFEFIENGEWREIPGSGRQASSELSSMAITLTAATGSYHLTHLQQTNNWTLTFHPSGGSVQTIETMQLPAADIRQGLWFRIELLVTEQTVTFMVNGQSLYLFDHDMQGNVSVGVESLSSDLEFQLDRVETAVSPISSSTLLANVQIAHTGAQVPLFRFHPFRAHQEYPLISNDITEITVAVIAAVSGQHVTIMGKPGASATVATTGESSVEVPIRVISKDGSASRTYNIHVTPVPPWDGYELAFSDEFDGAVLDTAKWNYRTGSRWDSIQRAANVEVQDGRLVIRLEVAANGQQYTGGVISKQALGHGYYETRTRLWRHPGWHAAFWQMQSSGLRVNEIDGFESTQPDQFTTNLHYYYPRHILGSSTHSANVASEFNVFGWEWLPGRVRFYFNGKLIRESEYPGPHTPAHVWLSCVAHPNASTADLPGSIEFEYFRFYKPSAPIQETLANALIVDTRSPRYHETGTWETSAAAVSHRGDFQTRMSRQPGGTSSWSATVARNGWYEVFVWNPYVFNDGTVSELNFQITNAEGVGDGAINPMRDGQTWVSLGRYPFSMESAAMVTLQTETDQPHRADAVAFLPVSSELEDVVRTIFPSANEWPSGQISGAWIGDFSSSAEDFPWILHPNLGKAYLYDAGSEGDLFLYMTAVESSTGANQIGWVYTRSAHRQFVYSFSKSTWFYLSPGASNTLWLFNYNSMNWENYDLG